jgi:hypothetical protein
VIGGMVDRDRRLTFRSDEARTGFRFSGRLPGYALARAIEPATSVFAQEVESVPLEPKVPSVTT